MPISGFLLDQELNDDLVTFEDIPSLPSSGETAESLLEQMIEGDEAVKVRRDADRRENNGGKDGASKGGASKRSEKR